MRRTSACLEMDEPTTDVVELDFAAEDQERRDMYDEHADYCPTPEQIAAECRRIREGWSEREHWKRAGFSQGKPRWEPRMVVTAIDHRKWLPGS